MRSTGFPPRRPSALLRYILPAAAIIFLLYYFTTSSTDNSPQTLGTPRTRPGDGRISNDDEAANTLTEHDRGKPKKETEGSQIPINGNKDGKTDPKDAAVHPISRLMSIADKQFTDTLQDESYSLEAAAAAYRKRRGRHPPPGFDQWYKFATEKNAIVVESFWDQIYHDLGPFWAMPAPLIRKEAWDFEMTINIRSGNATAGSDWFWTQIWLSMVKTIEHLLPDMDLALNAMDEPRIVVPWEDVDDHMTKAASTVRMLPPKDVVTEFQTLAAPGKGQDRKEQIREKNWERTKEFWPIVRRGCSPESTARTAKIMTDFDHAPVISPSLAEPHLYKGFVSNYTLSTEVCHQSDLQGLNGVFIEPNTVAATKVLFPMFGGSKLAVNNEILLPAPMYWNEEERFTGGDDHGVPWNQKSDGVIWRGVATGGRNRATNWRAFQRHRFVAMNNATKLQRAEQNIEAPINFAMPSPSYNLAASKAGTVGKWVEQWSDTAFVDLMCVEPEEGGHCSYTDPQYEIKPGVQMVEQFHSKYLPDIDGNSFSGRYIGFMRSTSLPIKATLYKEWHDSRLVAWKHFVPMDNRYGDWYSIMEYFLGYKMGDDKSQWRDGHDAAAQKIATAGKEWAEKVLRKEDMQVYTLRLLLEYARLSDERRERMGYVQDLV